MKKDIFAVTVEQLAKIVEHPNLLSQQGGVGGVCRSLRVDPSTGLMSDESFDRNYGIVALNKEQQQGDNLFFKDRKLVFGKNLIPEAPSKTLFQLIWIAYNDQTLGKYSINNIIVIEIISAKKKTHIFYKVMLSIAAIVSLVVGIWEDESSSHPIDEPKVGWYVIMFNNRS
jgi:Ca2+-transporting ATPase